MIQINSTALNEIYKTPINTKIDSKIVTACYGNYVKCNKATIKSDNIDLKKIG